MVRVLASLLVTRSGIYKTLAHPPYTHPLTPSTYYNIVYPYAHTHTLTKTLETRRPRFVHLTLSCARLAWLVDGLLSSQQAVGVPQLCRCDERSHISSFMRTRVYSSEDRAAAIFAFHALQLHLDLLELGLCIWQVQGSELDRDVGGHF